MKVRGVDRRAGHDALFTLQEAQLKLNIGRTLFWAEMARGNLPWVQIGRTRRINPRDLAQYLERNRRGGGFNVA
jgi:excisionase family DNA binding protein